jgi:AcrR family transcriptional regulator
VDFRFRLRDYTESEFRLSTEISVKLVTGRDELTPPTKTPTPPPLPQVAKPGQRADARRNREAIVVAARERFGELGLDCQMEDVARSAGVGIGTVYRHFPNKGALIEALIEERFTRLAERANEALEQEDPWEAFCDLMRWSARLSAEDRDLSGVLTQRPESCGISASKTGLPEATAKLIRKAQRSGQMRKDVVVEDVPTFMCGLGGVIGAPADSVPAQNWERLLGLVLDGMRAPGNTETRRLPKPKGSLPS